MVTRHEFLALLHDLVQPASYLEIGVQHGYSMDVALRRQSLQYAIGIDPQPLKAWTDPRVHLYETTSDSFFMDPSFFLDREFVEMAFIDGMHLAEYAYRDLVNVIKYSHEGTVIVLDDVLPTTQAMAARKQCPGDWTGDVWKLLMTLPGYVVDTSPTGSLVLTYQQFSLVNKFQMKLLVSDEVPDWILRRDAARIVQPHEALEAIKEDLRVAKVHVQR